MRGKKNRERVMRSAELTDKVIAFSRTLRLRGKKERRKKKEKRGERLMGGIGNEWRGRGGGVVVKGGKECLGKKIYLPKHP